MLTDGTTLISFGLASAVLIVSPGPTMFYIVARSLEQGKEAGFVSALASFLSAIVHFMAAGLGLSTILMTSTVVFSTVKYAGALYLIYLGIQTLRSNTSLSVDGMISRDPLLSIFYQGVAVHTLNPKAAIFFLAFLPQFLDPTQGSIWKQLIPLCIIYTILGLVIDGTCAVIAGQMREWIARSPLFMRRQKYVAGGTYIALGIAASTVSGSQKSIP